MDMKKRTTLFDKIEEGMILGIRLCKELLYT